MIRVVFDTNVVLSALLFTSGRLAGLRRSWQHERLRPLICRETVDELWRVLAYPKFKLTIEDRYALLEDYLPWAEVVTLPDAWPPLPLCRDPNDQVFLVLAHFAKADVLISGDKDILAVRDEFPGLVMTPEEWADHPMNRQ